MLEQNKATVHAGHGEQHHVATPGERRRSCTSARLIRQLRVPGRKPAPTVKNFSHNASASFDGLVRPTRSRSSESPRARCAALKPAAGGVVDIRLS
jgi:hypothetical protein